MSFAAKRLKVASNSSSRTNTSGQPLSHDVEHPADHDAARPRFQSSSNTGQQQNGFSPNFGQHESSPKAIAVQNAAHPNEATSRKISPYDVAETRDKVFLDIVNWDYLKRQFRRVDHDTCLRFLQSLCEDMPSGLLPKIQQMFSVMPVPKIPLIDKYCPKCNIRFSCVTERYYHCGKDNNPYNIYKCKQCIDEGRIGEYSDMQRLNKHKGNQFKKLNYDVKLAEWIRKEKNGKLYWWLNARGQKWTRCDEPTCHALYKYFSGTAGKHSVEKCRKT